MKLWRPPNTNNIILLSLSIYDSHCVFVLHILKTRTFKFTIYLPTKVNYLVIRSLRWFLVLFVVLVILNWWSHLALFFISINSYFIFCLDSKLLMLLNQTSLTNCFSNKSGLVFWWTAQSFFHDINDVVVKGQQAIALLITIWKVC